MAILSARARVAGIIGWPVGHSRSPRLHGYWLEKHKIDGAYIPLPIPPEHFRDAVRGLMHAGFAGANVTIPHKLAAFEVCDDLGRAPDILAIPVGNAGNISAYWAGFGDYRSAGFVTTLPRMFGFQAEGAAPIVLGHRVEAPDTIATAIRIGDPASWTKAVAARDESGGLIEAVSDTQILDAWRDLAHLEGVFCEPSSAASLAGIRRLAAGNRLDRDATIVCVLTGSGLKDPTTAAANVGSLLVADPTASAVAATLGW